VFHKLNKGGVQVKIDIYHASQLGYAEEVSEDLGSQLGEANHEVTINDLNGVSPSDLTTDALNIFISSTTGSGQVPDNGWFFMDALDQQKPDLSDLCFAIFGLGDTGYDDTYNMGSELVMGALRACGAKQIGERGLHDASSDEIAEDVVNEWIGPILSEYDQQL